MTENTGRPFTAASFNQFLSENKLMGSRCTRCQGIFLPPRAICTKCHSSLMEWVEMSGKGRLAAFTSVFIGPTFMNEAGFGRDNPYLTGIVELEEGVKISARLLGLDARHPESIQIGIPMELEFTGQGEGEERKAVLAFRP
jgi:uncharacterized OB-fold protein